MAAGLARLRVLVTRPQPQAYAWVLELRASGIDAHALPLLAIEPLPAHTLAARKLAAAWQGLRAQSLVVFVSPNAVTSFFAARPVGAAWPRDLPAASPGPGSDEALAQAGITCRIAPPSDAPQFDSESLWQRLHDRPWPRVTIVRGDGGRELLTERLRDAGAQVTQVQAYRRVPPRWDAQQQALYDSAAAAPAQHVWLLSSAQALAHLPPAAPAARAGWQALASHPRIADAARALGWGEVALLRPGVAAVVQALNRIDPP